MQPDTTDEEAAPRALDHRPMWLQNMTMRSGYSGGSRSRTVNEFDTTTTTRGVQAGRTAAPQAAPVPARVPPAVVPQAVPVPTQQRTVTAGRTAPSSTQACPPMPGRQPMLALGPNNRMDIANPEFYQFLQDARSHADITTGNLYHMANREIAAPQHLRWE